MSNKLKLSAAAALAAMSLSATVSFPASGYDSYDRNQYSGDRNDCSGSDSYRRSSLNVVGLTSDQRLVCFNEFRPGEATNIGSVQGLSGGDTFLVGIDFRVQNRSLYGVGNAGGIYLLNISNATATLVNRLTTPLQGNSFGVDFNPPADRLRIVSDTGQNLRHNVNAGGVTAIDTTLNNLGGAVALGVAGAAYTNNDLDPSTNTTLYDIDTARDVVAVQSPPNAGNLVANGNLTVDATAVTGFDTYSTIRNGVTVNVQSLASITTADGANRLYSINVPTGKATSRGSFSFTVVDIAIPLNQL